MTPVHQHDSGVIIKMDEILLVEDSDVFQQMVCEILNGPQIHVTCVANGKQALDHLNNKKFQLILLDISLPDNNGFELFSVIQTTKLNANTPIIFLTGKGKVEDRVRGFNLGAEDYIVKPFEPMEFLARVGARLAQAKKGQGAQSPILRKGDLEVNLSVQRAYDCSKGGRVDLNLTAAEFRILAFLVQNEDKPFTGMEILSTLWQTDVHVVKHNVYTHIYGLRKKLGPLSVYVQSHPRGGYSFRCS